MTRPEGSIVTVTVCTGANPGGKLPVTVKGALPVTPSRVALMTVVPDASADTRPVDVTDATWGVELRQTGVLTWSVIAKPLVSFSVACACTLSPTASVGAIETSMSPRITFVISPAQAKSNSMKLSTGIDSRMTRLDRRMEFLSLLFRLSVALASGAEPPHPSRMIPVRHARRNLL